LVLLYSQQGQLANRLWQAAYFISNAIENDYKFLHLGFAEYLIFFDENCHTELNKTGTKCRIIDFKMTGIQDRIIIKYANLSEKFNQKHKCELPYIKKIYKEVSREDYDITQPCFQKLVEKNIVKVDGWIFVDKNSLKRHEDIIRKVFRPNQIYIDNIHKLKEECFSKYDEVIGVHLRKKDYSTFNNGKWFYSNMEYLSFLNRILMLPRFKNRKIGFLLCSDEKINMNDFSSLNIIKSTSHFIEDLYALSFCNFIVGPPSTFSSWASFYGGTPLLHIDDKDMKFTDNDFKIVEY